MAPTCAELSKRLENLENRFESKLTEMVEKISVSVQSKLADNPGLIIENMRKEMDEFRESLNFLNASVEQLTAEKKELKDTNRSLLAHNAMLEQKVADLEQYSRKNNVEIRGVPCTQGENCIEIVQSIGNKINCPVSKDDLDVVHRVPSSSSSKNLIVRFRCRTTKAEFISKARKARLQTSDIGFHGTTTTPVYVNDHLTQENKKLFAKALALKREKKWQYLWTEDCVIKARYSSDSRVFRIRAEGDLAIFRSS